MSAQVQVWDKAIRPDTLLIIANHFFQKPAKLTLPHCAVDIDDVKMLSKMEGSDWSDGESSVVTADHNVITAEIHHFTLYGAVNLVSDVSMSNSSFTVETHHLNKMNRMLCLLSLFFFVFFSVPAKFERRKKVIRNKLK